MPAVIPHRGHGPHPIRMTTGRTTAVITHYAWSAVVVTSSRGLFDVRGMSRAPSTATVADLKAAVARDVAVEQQCDPAGVTFIEFTYTDLSA